MVLPIHDNNPTRRTPLVTYLLIGFNLFVFVLSPVVTHVIGDGPIKQQCHLEQFYDKYAAVPHELVQNRPEPFGSTGRVVLGHCQVEQPPPYSKSPFLSVLTSMFLHGGWLHLLGNLLFLFVFGNNVEDRLGKLRYLLFYLGCGYAATYGFALLNPTSTAPLIGASGAISGVLGAYLVLFPSAKVWSLVTFLFFLPVRLPAWFVLGSWFVLQYVYSRAGGISGSDGVAYQAHLIGFLVGAVLIWPLRSARRALR